ncbi:MAG TPA: hypothetical protein PKK06_09670 [Phycisphaerae bacterium]|nr:hypothetical protein [Phycisphaerae bacterium]HNU45568.1 hypothetical protein [Phycisphaerae bacterium]
MKTLALTVIAAGTGLLVVACAHRGGTGVSLTPQARPAAPAPAELPYREQRLREALAGLTFEAGLVGIDAEAADQLGLPGRGDAAWAAGRVEAGTELLAANDIVGALGAYRDAIVAAPDLAAAYLGLGRALFYKGKTEYAFAAARTTLQLDPQHVEAGVLLGILFDSTARWDEAVAQYQRVLEIDPRNEYAHVRLPVVYYFTGDPPAARAAVAAAAAAGYETPPQLPALLADQPVEPPPSQPPSRGVGIHIGPQVRVDVAGGAFASNETTMSSSEANPSHMVGAWNDWRNSTTTEIIRVGLALSTNGGQSWTDYLIRPPVAYQSSVEGDPMTCYDNRTGDMWVGGISFASNGGIYVARKPAAQESFNPAVMARVSSSADKGWMAAGPDPTSPHLTRVYIAYNQGVLRSTDMGATWSAPVSLGSGLGLLPRVGPQGQVYVCYWDYTNGIWIRKSTNGGVSFLGAVRVATRLDYWPVQDGSRFPGWFRVPALASLAVNPVNGHLYCVYFDTTSVVLNQYNVNLYFTRSVDEGTTWSTPLVINGDGFPPGDQFFPWIEVDRDGVLHVLFYDTRRNPTADDTEHGYFDAYYSTSSNDGNTWTEYRLTPNMFDSYYDGLDRPGSQFLGDYNGLGLAGKKVYPCYLSTQNGNSDIFVNVIARVGNGDFDSDGDVDLADFAQFQTCFTAAPAAGPLPTACDAADFDADDTVDVNDYAEFEDVFTGP